MARSVKLRLRRYLTGKAFVDQLKTIKAFPGFVGDGLLEELDEQGILSPRVRLIWPETVARRVWNERHDDVGALTDPLEPDGPVWEAAVSLFNALQRMGYPETDGPRAHPFDDPAPVVWPFVRKATGDGVGPRPAQRYSVSNERYGELYDRGHFEDYYSGWQVLPAAEAAGIGLHIRLNMSDPETAAGARVDVRAGRLPIGSVHEEFGPSRALAGFARHAGVLDAVVWSVEEGDAALERLLRAESIGGGRFWLTDVQAARHEESRRHAAIEALSLHGVDRAAVVELCRFLAERWLDHEAAGKPLMAEAYRVYLAASVRLLQRAENLTFDEIAAAVGTVGSLREPVLHRIWPDWAKAQKARIVLTLRSAWSDSPDASLTAEEIDAFADFLVEELQDAVFLRLASFEAHVFGEDAQSPRAGMASDLQGMAVAIEQCVRVMGGEGSQLYDMFRRLWAGDPEVAGLLKSCAGLARQARGPETWPATKAEVAAIRSRSRAGAVVADLVMAHRLRGAVHHPVFETNDFELEKLMVTLLRAAAMTHAQTVRSGRERPPSDTDAATSGPAE